MPIIKLDNTTPAIQHLCKKDKRLAKVISQIGVITYEPYTDGYAFLIHEIIEQMLSIKAGAKIYGRLKDLCDGHITPEAISQLTDDQIRSTGTSTGKVSYIRSLTHAITLGQLDLSQLSELEDAEVTKSLTAIRGIGTWTAKMYLIFVLDRNDILPVEDAAFLQAYEWLYKVNDRSAVAVTKKCKKWKPYTSVAARYLYRALDSGLTKNEFHLKK